MFNSQKPDINDLPTSKQLLRSTGIAITVAAVLLITTILPAEYGFDPTRIGKVLGLKKMGEIKASLKDEAQKESSPKPAIAAIEAPVISGEPTRITAQKQQLTRSDSITIVLQPGQGAEVKVTMQEGQTVKYAWLTDGGLVNYDNHGDSPNTSYHGYEKGKMVANHTGSITAAFHGNHGWYWKNRTEKPVTLTLGTSGEYSVFKRVL